MKITLNQSYSFCQQGLRNYQEDSRWPNTDIPLSSQRFFIVCDGVGGCEKGKVASQTVCMAMAKSIECFDLSKEFSPKLFSRALDAAYDSLDKMKDESNKEMATTMALLCFHAGGCTMAHIGDSRIYHFRKGEGIIYKSNDHSLVNDMVHKGRISPEYAESYSQKNVVTRYMSPVDDNEERWEATMVTTSDVKPDDILIVCSDGVTQCVNDNLLIELLESEVSDIEKLNQIAAECFYSSDNNTCILVSVKDVSDTIDCIDKTDSVNTLKLKHKIYKTLEVESSKHNNKNRIVHYIKAFFNLY